MQYNNYSMIKYACKPPVSFIPCEKFDCVRAFLPSARGYSGMGGVGAGWALPPASKTRGLFSAGRSGPGARWPAASDVTEDTCTGRWRGTQTQGTDGQRRASWARKRPAGHSRGAGAEEERRWGGVWKQRLGEEAGGHGGGQRSRGRGSRGQWPRWARSTRALG